MSTRVQKGSTVFRPVAKPRAKLASEARQTSAFPVVQGVHPTVSEGSHNLETNSTLPSQSFAHQANAEQSLQEDLSSDTVPRLVPSTSTSSSQPPRIVSKAPVPIVPTRRNLSQPTPIAVPSATPSATFVAGSSRHNVSQESRLPVPKPIAIPSSSAPRPSQPPPPTQGPSSRPPSVSQSPGVLNTLSDDVAQIDPALLEAVVTALQHVDQARNPPTFPPDTPSQIATSSEDPIPSQPPVHQLSRPQRKRTERPAVQDDNGDDEPSSNPPNKKKRAPRKRVRSATSEGTHQEGEEESPGTPSQRKRKKSGTPRKRRSQASSPPPFDPTVDPGEEIDPTAVTMGALCDDPGRGRVSSKAAQILNNHATWRTTNREKRARMRAIMEAKKYGRDLEEEEENGANVSKTSPPSPSPAANPEASTSARNDPADTGAKDIQDGDNHGNGFDYTQNIATSRYNVQVRIGPNGETIIDEDSLFVDRNQEGDTATYTHIEESDTSKFVNSSTYSKKLRGSRWSAEETELFYDALSQFGENYELISYVLPGRDRKACKNKFKAEDRKHPARITHCLTNRRPYDIETLARMTGKDFSGPTPVIRTPTPALVPQEPTPEPESHTTGNKRVSRKKGRTPAADVEVLGNISDIDKDDE